MNRGIILMLAALGLGAASCANEKETSSTEPASLSFQVSTPRDPLVLEGDEVATRAIASQDEWNISSIDIYATTDAGAVEKLAATDFTISPAPGSALNATYTVTLSDSWLVPRGGQTVNFYIVANDATSSGGAHTSLADNLDDEAAFREALTNALTDNGDGTLAPIAQPDGTSVDLLFSADMQDILIANTVKEKCLLSRREARFDIQNKTYAPGTDQLIITGIEIINAPEAGLVFGGGSAATQEAVDRTRNIALPGLDPATDYTETAPGSEIAGDLATSVFYLYPTTLVSPGADAPANRTQIVVAGTYNGETVSYAVEVPMETPIQANFRYILNIDATHGVIELVSIDYNEGGTFPAGPENTVRATVTPLPDDIEGAGLYSTTSSMGKVFAQIDPTVRSTMPIDATSEVGTIFKLSPNPTTVRLYKTTEYNADGSKTEHFTVMVPAGDEPLEAMLVIDSGNNLGADTIHIRRMPPPNIVTPQEPYIVYYDSASRTLQLSDWSAPVTRAAQENNIMAFKFGSVVGVDMTTSNYAATAVMLNPMADPLAVTDNWASVPNYVTADFEAGITYVSDAAYHTYENVALGKGDPCKLIGLTADQIKQGLIDNKRFRLPTIAENEALHPSGSTITGDFTAGSTTSGIYFGDPQATFLPAAGYRDGSTGALSSQGSIGDYWLSMAYSATKGHNISFGDTTVIPGNNNTVSLGFPVRCVPADYVAPYVAVSDVSLDITSRSGLYIGDSFTITATVAPANATNKGVTWTSDNPAVATVDTNGVVTTTGLGNAVITATTDDGGKTETCTVSVTSIPVSGVSLDITGRSGLYAGDSFTITATVAPADAANKGVTWTSNNTAVATVDANGLVRTTGLGNAVITATTVDGSKTATCTVSVTGVHATGVSLNFDYARQRQNSGIQLAATVSPANATNKSVSWYSDNPAIANVDGNGLVRTTTAGVGSQTYIHAVSADGGINVACRIEIVGTASSQAIFALSGPNMTVFGGTTVPNLYGYPEYGLTGLVTQIFIESGITRLDDGAFYALALVTKVYVRSSTPPTIGGVNVFDSTHIGSRTLYVPYGSENNYRANSSWSSKFANIVGF